MRKIMTALASLTLAAGMALPASAATTQAASAAPRPHCLIGTWLGPCSCPRGWYVHTGAFHFYCSRKKPGFFGQ